MVQAAVRFCLSHTANQSPEMVPASLGLVAYSESLITLSQTGLALVTSTLTAVLLSRSL